MATNNHVLESVWKDAKEQGAGSAPLAGKELKTIVAVRTRKEYGTAGKYVWAMIVYQTILYWFLARTAETHWTDKQTVLLCLAGAALYSPLTVALIRRVKALFGGGRKAASPAAPDLLQKVEEDYTRLAEFFRFKKQMDWVGVPVSSAIIVMLTFTWFVQGGVEANPAAGIVVFAAWVGVSLIATRAENRKRFITPLRRLEELLAELRDSGAMQREM